MMNREKQNAESSIALTHPRENREIKVKIIRSARKTISLEVRGEDEVLLRIPRRLSLRSAHTFVREHEAWIWEKTGAAAKRQASQRSTGAVPVDELTPEELARIKDKIAGRVEHYAHLMGVTVGRITIRNQKTRWGSCSAKGNLNFNYQLYYLPEEFLDYVVIHELAHRKQMNHSALFWAEVERFCPEYRECRAKMKEYRLV